MTYSAWARHHTPGWSTWGSTNGVWLGRSSSFRLSSRDAAAKPGPQWARGVGTFYGLVCCNFHVFFIPTPPWSGGARGVAHDPLPCFQSMFRAGRKSLERLLPHYLYGLRQDRQEKKVAQTASWLPASNAAETAAQGAEGGLAQQQAQQHTAQGAADPPQLGGRLPGGPPSRSSMRSIVRPSFMHRPSFAVNGFSVPPEPIEEDRSTVRRSTFWARGKTTPTQGSIMPPVRRSRTLDLGRRNGQGASQGDGYGVGSAAYGAPKPRSSRLGVADDITVARASRDRVPPRGEDVSQDGMWEFESMMARRVAMFGRPSVAQ